MRTSLIAVAAAAAVFASGAAYALPTSGSIAGSVSGAGSSELRRFDWQWIIAYQLERWQLVLWQLERQHRSG